MTPLAWIGLVILALPWLCSLTAVLWGLAIWWSQPRHTTPVTPPAPRVKPVRPDAKQCPDCSHRQRPDWTACWLCGANMDRETSPHLWV